MLNQSKRPTVSVIMAVRDAAPWLSASIESILAQTMRSLEFLILNDGSIDGTGAILDYFQSIDSRVKVYTNDVAKGLPASLNFLIKQAEGPYIARMDGDDISHATRLQAQLAFMASNREIGICFTEANIILDDDEFLCKKWTPRSVNIALKMLPVLNYFVHPTAFVRREVYLNDGLYDEKFLKAQDWELWQRLSARNIQFGIVPEVLLDYRLRLNSSSASLSSSSSHGSGYFKAIVMIRNHHKLESIRLMRKIPKQLFFRYFLNIATPQVVFFLVVALNSIFNKDSAARKLMRQSSSEL